MNKLIIKLIKSLPSHLRNWYEFSKNGRNNHIVIYSFGKIYSKDIPFIIKKEGEIIRRMDRSTIKNNPECTTPRGTKIKYTMTENDWSAPCGLLICLALFLGGYLLGRI